MASVTFLANKQTKILHTKNPTYQEIVNFN